MLLMIEAGRQSQEHHLELRMIGAVSVHRVDAVPVDQQRVILEHLASQIGRSPRFAAIGAARDQHERLRQLLAVVIVESLPSATFVVGVDDRARPQARDDIIRKIRDRPIQVLLLAMPQQRDVGQIHSVHARDEMFGILLQRNSDGLRAACLLAVLLMLEPRRLLHNRRTLVRCLHRILLFGWWQSFHTLQYGVLQQFQMLIRLRMMVAVDFRMLLDEHLDPLFACIEFMN
mmetsp:Transcript_18762/g.53470  ORF Transcript_18762/g.53470 Transcript_18762/m.53470 type:complete len:231 (+) Transcript_18762:904-1596(+)